MWLFPNSLNKKRMNGRSKILGKKIGPHAYLRVDNYSFLWCAKPHRKPITPWTCARCEHVLMTQQIVCSKEA